ncbi:hypothetical protein LTR84_000242 [Exophiala bonariae]|uniref:Zn(2)-C6 fungal-type domain-containing protein n=1 Tax=Exophiala bonariae TaxID=1690606 RepID=A0AAV9NPZ1_9EURO|nr:hypothetical protein LTR84_000242 [Exophiala bonariae]
MLQPDRFMEGVEQPNSEQPPTKELQEEHPQCLRAMCQALHHLPVQPVKSIEELHVFADVCNFYGCVRALSFQIQSWTERWDFSTLASSQLQRLLWVSFIFHLRSTFKQASSRLAQSLTPAQWKAWDVHPMPAKLKEDVRTMCEDLKWDMQMPIENAFGEVINNEHEHDRNDGDKKCSDCGLNKPRQTRKCGNCRSTNFEDYVCTNATRLLSLEGWLHREDLWPLSDHRGKSCHNLNQHRQMASFHVQYRDPCADEKACPLLQSKEKLRGRMEEAFDKSPGLSLDNYDDENEVPE